MEKNMNLLIIYSVWSPFLMKIHSPTGCYPLSMVAFRLLRFFLPRHQGGLIGPMPCRGKNRGHLGATRVCVYICIDTYYICIYIYVDSVCIYVEIACMYICI